MHVYASLSEFKDFLREQGSTSLGTNQDATMLGVLESASRRIDEFCGRGSGFGPATAIRKYDGDGGCELSFAADLATSTPTITCATATGGTGVAVTVETDYYLRSGSGGYSGPPWREMVFHSGSRFGAGYRVTSVSGTWGYPVITRDLAVTTAEALDATEQVVDVSALTGISPGMTLLCESEQLYVSATTDAVQDTITVDRGCNGTTAATHDTAKTLQRIIYNAAVVDACNRVALRRWRARDAGADGMDGGGQVGVIAPREGEDLILLRTVGHLKIWPVA
jgi:hypothetical protein